MIKRRVNLEIKCFLCFNFNNKVFAIYCNMLLGLLHTSVAQQVTGETDPIILYIWVAQPGIWVTQLWAEQRPRIGQTFCHQDSFLGSKQFIVLPTIFLYCEVIVWSVYSVEEQKPQGSITQYISPNPINVRVSGCSANVLISHIICWTISLALIFLDNFSRVYFFVLLKPRSHKIEMKN